ncbi:chondroitin sulfate proteoglycan 4-like [Varanus komodoensis]|uniref:chondroitin sulfate proteoglycan 4-like n=1 Tax=Varanus komodoensis TaxID=61221 RepID=UPI001CF7EB02|nr:chondroitin sulfate proteoglycan 4-like [Varanus komodoensis]
MASGWRWTSAWLLLLLALSRELLAASFYGDSYVQLNIAESSSTISLKLHFQTSKPDGLLFLAAGKEAYFLVELHSGNINVRLNFGGGEQVLSSHLSSQLNDLVWHLLEVHHERDNIALVIDNNYQTSTKLLGTLFELKIEHGIFVGGSGELRFPYFDGCTRMQIVYMHSLATAVVKQMAPVSLQWQRCLSWSLHQPVTLTRNFG